MLPLFDSLAHPTVSGKWLRGETATAEALVKDLSAAGFFAACAVGLQGVGDYQPQAFLEMLRPYPQLLPVAGFEANSAQSIAKQLAVCKRAGFVAAKVHPRFSGLDYESPVLGEIFQAAAELDFPIFYCTYAHCAIESYPSSDPFFALVRALQGAPRARVMLVHGGDVQVMRYAELVRHNPQLLLDLSLTISKYQGSSLDQDLRFLFQKFDQRICIGSDHPECSHQVLRARFEEFARGLDSARAERIGYRNLLAFLKRDDLCPK